MIYFLIAGVIFFVIIAALYIYCRFTYLAMLDDIDVKGFASQEKDKAKMTV